MMGVKNQTTSPRFSAVYAIDGRTRSDVTKSSRALVSQRLSEGIYARQVEHWSYQLDQDGDLAQTHETFVLTGKDADSYDLLCDQRDKLQALGEKQEPIHEEALRHVLGHLKELFDHAVVLNALDVLKRLKIKQVA